MPDARTIAASPEAAPTAAPAASVPFGPDRNGIVIDIDAVDLERNGSTLLDGVSATVRAGEHWTLLGPNGAGKSTLLSIVGAHVHPTRGTATMLNHRMGRVDVFELRRHIGHVDPRHPVRGRMTMLDVVLTGITGTVLMKPRWEPTDEELERAHAQLSVLHVDGRADADWSVLSQGERGRTLIARALMPDPELLLLDEPATGLDVAAREQLIASIDAVHKARPDLSSVLVTHHLEELPPSTTHAMLIGHGRIMATGPVDDVLTTERVSRAFEFPIEIGRNGSRWTATAAR
ncbi:ABC transporter ATP-binding protein [Spelaeicoccus albus]|uniref:Iron complex transport system ATP-binding protein n=1 Tax=Spelaeicoccus albus TaxID=1280376 RepID=A0A7Z0A7C2_9MICO|nr:ATP-binding cassette domain-containing protein [Spelaeicoccus albus]NYI65779.1 iron complex transport system ATP-binding protein [Spelaeicoccus albus]